MAKSGLGTAARRIATDCLMHFFRCRAACAFLLATSAALGVGGFSPAAPASNLKIPARDDPEWAFRPVQRPAIPTVGKGVHPIDAFLGEALGAKGLTPAPAADRRTLLRRATFDLHGLPPTHAEVEAFLADKRPTNTAFRDIIERLLASPRYGEKWGRHWLDVVRYADTGGGSNDFERPNAWRYRDYVVRALNEDKRYDRFVLEQLAGDELPEIQEIAAQREGSQPASQGPVMTTDAILATGFLRMGPWEHTAMSVEAVTRQQWLDDVTGSASVTFLGLTTGCARCHDHKFDPIPTRDYYRLQAVFASTQFTGVPAAWHPSENRSQFVRDAARIHKKLQRLKQRLAELPEKSRRAIAHKHGVSSAGELPRTVVEEAVRSLFGLDSADLERERIYRKWTQIYEAMLPRYEAVAYGVSPAKEHPGTHVLQAGQLTAPGEKVAPGVISAVKRLGGAPEPQFAAAPAGQRLALARWMVAPGNPLTSRVIVNRVWQWHFGRGLVNTPSNLGKMGGRPSHPELLDWLANTFTAEVGDQGSLAGGGPQGFRARSSARGELVPAIAKKQTRDGKPTTALPRPSSLTPNSLALGWSLKALHRLIMTSAAYQRAGMHPEVGWAEKVDPEFRFLSRFPPRRLEAEELRDSILAVSGELNLEAGGPGVLPEINEELAQQPRHVMGTIAPVWEPSPTRAERNRRTIYTYQQRSLMNPLVEVFNGANSNDTCERRLESTVAPQVFNLFNSRFSYDSALAFADRVARVETSLAGQVTLAFRLALQREPTAVELRVSCAHLEQMRRYHRANPPRPAQIANSLVRKAVVEQTGETVEIEEERVSEGYEHNLQPSQVSAETRALAEHCLVLLNTNEFVYVY